MRSTLLLLGILVTGCTHTLLPGAERIELAKEPPLGCTKTTTASISKDISDKTIQPGSHAAAEFLTVRLMNKAALYGADVVVIGKETPEEVYFDSYHCPSKKASAESNIDEDRNNCRNIGRKYNRNTGEWIKCGP